MLVLILSLLALLGAKLGINAEKRNTEKPIFVAVGAFSQTILSLCLDFACRKGDFAANLAEIGWRDVEKRRNVLQWQLLHDLRTALQQQFIALTAIGTIETAHAAIGLQEEVLHDKPPHALSLVTVAVECLQLFARKQTHTAWHDRFDRHGRRFGCEAVGIVAHKLALENEADGVLVLAVYAALAIFETTLLHEAYPVCGLAFTLQQLTALVADGLAFALAQLMNIILKSRISTYIFSLNCPKN